MRMTNYQKLEILKSSETLPDSLYWEIASDAEIFGISFSEMKQRTIDSLVKQIEASLK